MSSRDDVQRSSLPIPDIQHTGLITYDAKDPDTRFPPIHDLRPPKGAPNVLVILIDDVGYGATSAFGGPCQTPNFAKLAKGGLQFTRFHTTALCSPTRQALLTGRNHHSVGMGGITEIATAAPGQCSVLPNTKAPLALTLKLNGYATAQFGKCHEVPVWQTSPAGPFNAWPTGGGGFEYFYGFIGGENNQWDPALYEGTTPIEPPKTPAEGYHLTEDLTDKFIAWTRQQKALLPDKPFFVYFAPGATHAPHHVPREWIDKYKGKFAHGWDKQREITFAKQKELGLVAANAELTARHKEIPAWDDMDPRLKPVLEREMEVYAAFMEHTDHHVGRMIDSLEEMGELDNTLIYLVIGDNGASAEGTLQGAFNEMANFNGVPEIETPEFMMSKLDEFGGEGSYGHYAVGWAWAMNSPYQWTKQVASHWGGTRNGVVVHWPKGIKEKGGIRNQFSHVIDIAPTVLEAAGLPEPAFVNGVQQSPYEGHEHALQLQRRDRAGAACHAVFRDVLQPRHLSQRLERGHQAPHAVGDEGREASGVRRRCVGAVRRQQGLDAGQGPGEGNAGEAARAAAAVADRSGQVQRAAARRPSNRALRSRAGRAANAHQGEHADPVCRHGTPVREQRDHHQEQVIRCHVGSGSAGEGRRRRDHRPGRPVRRVEPLREGWQGEVPLQHAGHQAVRHRSHASPFRPARRKCAWSSPTTAAAWAKAAPSRSIATARKSARAGSSRRRAILFSADETTDIGYESGTTVSPDYTAHTSRFNGKINWVQIDLGDDAKDADHYISAEERLRVAMARQ